MTDHPQKITFAEMREMGVRGVLIFCADYRCSHSIAVNADQWPDDLRLSDIEPRFICQACGKRGADVRPDFNWNRKPRAAMGISVMCRRTDLNVSCITDQGCLFRKDSFLRINSTWQVMF